MAVAMERASKGRAGVVGGSGSASSGEAEALAIKEKVKRLGKLMPSLLVEYRPTLGAIVVKMRPKKTGGPVSIVRASVSAGGERQNIGNRQKF